MTETQWRAFEQLRRHYPGWCDASDLHVSRATLDALVRRGLVESYRELGALFNPRLFVKYRVIPQAASAEAKKKEAGR